MFQTHTETLNLTIGLTNNERYGFHLSVLLYPLSGIDVLNIVRLGPGVPISRIFLSEAGRSTFS